MLPAVFNRDCKAAGKKRVLADSKQRECMAVDIKGSRCVAADSII